ncbi:MAG: prolipoprotein diacylglyceryl transferase family protein [Patescibacteria group bacterium]|nr:prolipoprotein diacylglyceryl transferase [Patescibacteria group bacterium]
MNQTLTIFGLNFHVYGLIVGWAVAVSWSLLSWRAQVVGFKPVQIWRVGVWLGVGGLVGARLWHVLTDWSVYIDHPAQIWQVWLGGLSILGAIVGMALGLYLVVGRDKQIWYKWLDILAVVLPIGQAFGRLANWINQELYGLPTNLPWGIAIDPSHRLVGYEAFTYFHPLFAYEAVATAIFGVLGLLLIWQPVIWQKLIHRLRLNQSLMVLWGQRLTKLKPGSLFVGYVLYYSIIRFGLDFLRIGTLPIVFNLDINQLILLMVGLGILGWWFKKNWAKYLLVIWIILMILMSARLNLKSNPQPANNWIDHSIQSLIINQQTMKVEIVNSPESIGQGLSGRTNLGSDGMLFIFPAIKQANFWMKDMKFDLDLIWIAQGKIVGITPNVPHPDISTPDSQLKIYTAPQPVDMVLEVPAGDSALQSWGVGDQLRIVVITNSLQK